MTMRRLAQSQPGPGYCHIPADREEEWFKQITAEKLVTRYVKGQPVREWHKPDKARNEALDCRNYAYAALKITQPNLKKIAGRMKSFVAPAKPHVIAEKPSKNPPKTPEKQPENEPENPPEERKKPVVENATVRRSAPANAPKRRNFVNNW
jgi:phage terminase large subunit GpA-like protein